MALTKNFSPAKGQMSVGCCCIARRETKAIYRVKLVILRISRGRNSLHIKLFCFAPLSLT